MDNGPFRVPQPADRRVVSSRPEPTSRQAEPAQPAQVARPSSPAPSARPTHRATPTSKLTKDRKSKPFILLIVALILIVAVGLVVYVTQSNSKDTTTAIDTSKYQAVFFTNGQVYFGKLQPFNDESMKLTDIYYLQTKTTTDTDSANPQKTSVNQSDVQIIKLGNEIHGPEDEMIISKYQMLFYENLKPDSKVAESIATFKKSQ